MKLGSLGAAFGLVLFVSSVFELASWSRAATARDHVATAHVVMGVPASADVERALTRSLGALGPAAALALEVIPVGSRIFVMRTIGPERDAFKKSSALAVALRSLLHPAKVAPLRRLLAPSDSREERGTWLVQLDHAPQLELLEWGLRVAAERPGVRIWVADFEP